MPTFDEAKVGLRHIAEPSMEGAIETALDLT
jgi:hypothetical protein